MTYTAKLFAACACLAVGEALGFSFAGFSQLWPLALAVLAAIALAGHGFGFPCWQFAFVFTAGAAIALLCADGRAKELNRISARDRAGEPVVARLKVEGAASRTSFRSTLRGIPVRVAYPAGMAAEEPREGETWECAGWLDLSGDDADDVSSRRLFWVGGAGGGLRKVPDGSILDSLVQRARRSVLRRAGIGLEYSPQLAGLDRAILLGERSAVPHAQWTAFADAGTMHVFAVSGLHVMIVARVIVALLAFLPPRARALASIPALWFYVLVSGGSPSAIRAAAMASLCMSAFAAWRRPNPVAAWALAFVVVYGLDPMRIFDTGCALSFAVMLGILLAASLAGRDSKAGFLLVPLAAWMSGMPIVAHVFGRITPGGILANLLLMPLVAVNVASSMLGVLTSFVSTFAAAHLNNLAALSARAMLGISEAVASLPGANFEVARWSWTMCACWYVAMAMALWLARRIISRRRNTL